MLSSADAEKLAFSAFSIAPTRITPDWLAPVAATRTSPALVLTTNTPVNAKRDAGCGNLLYPALAGTGNDTDVISSPPSSAVSNSPLKKLSAAIVRLLVFTVA